jgi:hypothetical protein
MGLFSIFKRKKKIDNREHLTLNGRITDGTITECETLEEGEVAYYVYCVQGADFESSEFLTEEMLKDGVKYAPGAKVGVRYDPRNHGNSILV